MTNTPPEVLENWRNEFEKGAQQFLHDSEGLFYSTALNFEKDCAGSYFNDSTDNMWKGFLMARQTAVIELPEKANWYLFKEVKEFIESQGYRVEVKGENPACK